VLACLWHCCSVVEFASSSDMKNAVEKLNETEVNGRVITVTEDRGRGSGGRRRRSPSRISLTLNTGFLQVMDNWNKSGSLSGQG